jgi:hypothetical protein
MVMEQTAGQVGVGAALRLLSVNVGLPRPIGRDRFGLPIISGIVKEPVAAAELSLTTTNLEGDRQADLSVHGGPDKAVYAYPAEHLSRWNAELGTAFGVGTFGENLTVSGMLEDEVRIGDLWGGARRSCRCPNPAPPATNWRRSPGAPTSPNGSRTTPGPAGTCGC